MNYVWLIRNISDPTQTYIGAPAELKQRIADHNAGKSAHTSKFVPCGLLPLPPISD
jgi:predicted GIY-YIG superfamily endonuclease